MEATEDHTTADWSDWDARREEAYAATYAEMQRTAHKWSKEHWAGTCGCER